MRVLKSIIALAISVLVVIVLIDLPEMGELLTAIRLFLLLCVIGLIFGVGKIVISIRESGK